MVGRVKPTQKAEPARDAGYTPIAELEKGLRIDEDALDEAHLQHADAFYRVSKQLAFLISQRDAAKQAVEDVEAEADQGIRQDAEKHEAKKITVLEVASLVRLDPSVKSARARFLSLAGNVNELTALKEAFQQRSYMLSGLTALYTANYFGPKRDGGDEAKRAAYREAHNKDRR